MPQKALPDQETLLRLFRYEHGSGKLFWMPRHPLDFPETKTISQETFCKQFNGRFAGREALYCVDNVGYRSGRLKNSQVRAHRVIWKMFFGDEPDLIDHINRIKTDNRLCNLRSANKSINGINQDLSKLNTSGERGVSYDKSRGKWVSFLYVNGNRWSKRFSTFDEAVAARRDKMRSFAACDGLCAQPEDDE